MAHGPYKEAPVTLSVCLPLSLSLSLPLSLNCSTPLPVFLQTTHCNYIHLHVCSTSGSQAGTRSDNNRPTIILNSLTCLQVLRQSHPFCGQSVVSNYTHSRLSGHRPQPAFCCPLSVMSVLIDRTVATLTVMSAQSFRRTWMFIHCDSAEASAGPGPFGLCRR